MKRRGSSEIVVFGRRAVLEALGQLEAKAGIAVEEVRVARDVPAPFRKQLAARVRGLGVPFVEGARRDVNSLSCEPRHDQGVAARVQLNRLTEVSSFIAGRKGRSARQPVRLLALDGVTNSQNIGMIVRSCVAAGLDGMLWPLAGSPWVNGLVIKSSASTLYCCDLLRCETLAEGLHLLASAGYEIAGLAGAGGENLFDYRVPHRAVFVLGGETLGLSEEVEGLIDTRLRIPMSPSVESLNVAVAASMVCFKATGVISGSEAGSGHET
jgi:23S rRNA (guanosine2251-2'-O)-methyltransferase